MFRRVSSRFDRAMFKGSLFFLSTLSCLETSDSAELHQRTLPAKSEQQTVIRGLKADSQYTCWSETVASSSEESHRSTPLTFAVGKLPLDLEAPRIQIPSQDLARTGYMLINYGTLHFPWRIENRYILLLDPQGNIRWFYSNAGGGDVDASFLGNDQLLIGGNGGETVPATIIGLDKRVVFQDRQTLTRPGELENSTNHDVGLSEDGQSIYTMTYASTGVYNSFVIKEIDIATDEVIWDWSGLEEGVQAGVLPPGSADDTDPHHANAIDDQWENGKEYLYVSLRDQNQVLKIDKLTGAVVWKLGVGGDFTLLDSNGAPAEDARWFFHQHDAKVYGPRLLALHDNGVGREAYGGRDYTRALQLELDQVAMTARIRFEYTEQGWEEPIWGGYDVLSDGRSLVAQGHCWECEVSNPGPSPTRRRSSLVELDPRGHVLWRAELPSEKAHLYRVERIDGCNLFDNLTYCPSKRREELRAARSK